MKTYRWLFNTWQNYEEIYMTDFKIWLALEYFWTIQI